MTWQPVAIFFKMTEILTTTFSTRTETANDK